MDVIPETGDGEVLVEHLGVTPDQLDAALQAGAPDVGTITDTATVHHLQGRTFDTAHVVIAAASSDTPYVAGTRGRDAEDAAMRLAGYVQGLRQAGQLDHLSAAHLAAIDSYLGAVLASSRSNAPQLSPSTGGVEL